MLFFLSYICCYIAQTGKLVQIKYKKKNEIKKKKERNLTT